MINCGKGDKCCSLPFEEVVQRDRWWFAHTRWQAATAGDVVSPSVSTILSSLILHLALFAFDYISDLHIYILTIPTQTPWCTQAETVLKKSFQTNNCLKDWPAKRSPKMKWFNPKKWNVFILLLILSSQRGYTWFVENMQYIDFINWTSLPSKSIWFSGSFHF